jgi:hypothetical protein
MARRGRDEKAKLKAEMMQEAANKMKAELAVIRRPYDRRDYADLDEDRQVQVMQAETRLYTAISLVFGVTKERLASVERESLGLSDDTMIDEPLRRMRALAQAYAGSGLAPDEAAAKRMADAFKESVVQFRRQWASERGGHR